MKLINYFREWEKLAMARNIQGVSGGIVNILGVGGMDYSEYINSYKHVSNF
jgi:hypothetical protein